MNIFLFELWNDSTKTIRLLFLDFYAVIVGEGVVNYHFLHCTLECRIPEGSEGTILSPLPFLISINDLPSCLSSSHSRMYADDTHFVYADNDITIIQFYLDKDLKQVLFKYKVVNVINVTCRNLMKIL